MTFFGLKMSYKKKCIIFTNYISFKAMLGIAAVRGDDGGRGIGKEERNEIDETLFEEEARGTLRRCLARESGPTRLGTYKALSSWLPCSLGGIHSTPSYHRRVGRAVSKVLADHIEIYTLEEENKKGAEARRRRAAEKVRLKHNSFCLCFH